MLMRKFIIFFFIFLILIFSCKKEENLIIDDQVSISPMFSVALGNFAFDMNDELRKLRNIMQILPDSLLYNDEIFPSPVVLDDTISYPFNFVSISKEFDNITLLMLRLIFNNGYPTDISVEASLRDTAGNEIYRKGPYNISGATIDDNYRVTEYSKSIFEFYFPDNVMSDLNLVTDIVFYYSVTTQSLDDILVRFYDNYNIKLHIGARVQYEISP